MSGFTCGRRLADGTDVVLIEDIFEGKRVHLERHSVEHCTCSFCHPWSSSFQQLPHPGRFEIHVPPSGNKWKWTNITWRWGRWQYYLKIEAQLFPSKPPFFHPEHW